MALISAHSEETSDAIYGGDEAAIYEASVQDIDLYRLCSVIFNDFVGITSSEPEAQAGSASIKSPPPVSRSTAYPALGKDVPTPPTVPKPKLPAEIQKEGSFREAAATAVAKHWQNESKSYPSGADTGPNHESESYFQDETYHPPALKFFATGALAGFTDDCVGLRLERVELGLSTTEARGVKRPSGGVLTSIGENESPVANSCEDLFDVLNAEIGPMYSKKRPSRQNRPATRSPSPALHVSHLPSSPLPCSPGFPSPSQQRVLGPANQTLALPTPPLSPALQSQGSFVPSPSVRDFRSLHAVAAGEHTRPLAGPLPIVQGFEFQGDVLNRLKSAVSNDHPAYMLVIQPTSSGKGAYARELSRRPGEF
jgi:hypothetical protein